MSTHDFSFAAHAAEFDLHITQSIPGLNDLRADTVTLSRDFVQNDAGVLDIGCSTGTVLRAIKDANCASRPRARYVGLDIELTFADQWRALTESDIRFQVTDARTFDGFQNLGLVCSMFTLQFIDERDRLSLLRNVYNGLNPGGALLMAEKVLATGGELQDLLSSAYYQHKRQNFTAEEILAKERSLRGQMRLWSQAGWLEALVQAGFASEAVEIYWKRFAFVAFVAKKRSLHAGSPINRSTRKPSIQTLT